MNHRPVLAVALSGSMLLTGCSSLLQRDYSAVTLHSAAPITESDQNTVRVESYQDLVNVLLYFVTQGRHSGTIRLYNFPYDVSQGLEEACAEVTGEDPLGAYCVESITYDVTPIVSCYEANFHISYRRTREQVSAIIPVTGTTAIRGQLQNALSHFQSELTLRINYFDGDEKYIRDLLEEAYLTAPENALSLPTAQITFYPEGSRQCIAEIALDYGTAPSLLNQRKKQLEHRSTQLAQLLQGQPGPPTPDDVCDTILTNCIYDPDGGSTPYDALFDQRADSMGLSMTLSLLCSKLGLSCQVVSGSLGGLPHYWNILYTDGGYRHVDLTHPPQTEEEALFRTDSHMLQAGYLWNTTLCPVCELPPEPPAP